MSDYVKLEDGPEARLRAIRAAIVPQNEPGDRVCRFLASLNFQFLYEIESFFLNPETQRLFARAILAPLLDRDATIVRYLYNMPNVHKNADACTWWTANVPWGFKLAATDGMGTFILVVGEVQKVKLVEIKFDAKGMV